MIQLDIENNTNNKIPTKKEIADVILNVLNDKKISGDFEVGIKIVETREIQEYNKKYRKIDFPTDVLSFPIYDSLPQTTEKIILLGDIIICPDMIEDNTNFLDLIMHSTLHLLGFHHK